MPFALGARTIINRLHDAGLKTFHPSYRNTSLQCDLKAKPRALRLLF
jgi:hypothetical protein